MLPAEPECRNVIRRMTVLGHSAFRLPCGDLHREPLLKILERPSHGRARIVGSTGRLAYLVRNAGGASEEHTIHAAPGDRRRSRAAR